MVLSNKKLKQILRALPSKEESQPNINNDPQTPHQILATQKPILTKREIRRRRKVETPQNLEKSLDLEKKESESKDGGLKEINNKKRKREKDEDLGEKKTSKKKNKKKKTKKKKVKVEESVKKENVENEEKGKVEVKKEIVKSEEQVKVKMEVEESVKNEFVESEEQVKVKVEEIPTQISKEDESISTKIYVGGIPYYSTVDDIRSFFEGCGSITEIDCLKFPETGKFNGIAMISFRTDAAAKRALTLDGSDMGGLLLKVQPYKANREKKVSDFAPAMLDGYNRIYVGNLSWDMTEDDLKKFFSDCSISSIRLGKDKETGEFRGFAHVDFSDSLSLTMALKLDQKLLSGRPVRVRCAVPPKSANPSSKSDSTAGKNEGTAKFVHVGASGDMVVDDAARKAKRQTCYECGEKGHHSSSCPNKKAADMSHTDSKTNDIAFYKENDAIGDGMLKRRTCYECGEKGHLSSSCPNKKAANVAYTSYRTDDMVFNNETEEADHTSDGKLKRRSCYECGEKGHLSSSCPKKQATDVANTGRGTFASVVAADINGNDYNMVNSVSDGKLRRRTCYECGERGHLSSACPKKPAAGEVNTIKEPNDDVVKKAELMVVGKDVGDNMASSISDGKLRRRTCYECGERGHLSSLCPKKQAADVANVKNVNDIKVEKANVVIVGKEAGDGMESSVSEGKLRRRTCYECGERGHVSSLCPIKQAADVANSSKDDDAMEVEMVEVVKTTSVASVSSGKIKRRICYECGLKGHLSSLCPNKLQTGLTA
uniref:phragmoplastin interacting protein 1 n=1 Tax=Erigeron canadensis TaxID=72917 RepID=UPI001CB9105F|nr:phragmoplastin interacting protein 1 [Erigeron canadensis]